MCGIMGYAGHRPAIPVVMEGLRHLEYRGYDSAGVAWQLNGQLHFAKTEGKLSALEQRLSEQPSFNATTAMGHTRWATHGAPVERNAHPHLCNDGTLALVHNGIIENFEDLKAMLRAEGFAFASDTDTEVLVNLISFYTRSETDLLTALARALKDARGAYAICLMSNERPGELYAARMSAPLVLGLGQGEHFIASDIPAFLAWTRDVVFLEDGEIATITAHNRNIYKLDGLEKVERQAVKINWDMQAAQKDGYKHYMLKEIFEQPRVIGDGLAGRFRDGLPFLPELEKMDVPNSLHIVACGTSWHSGLWAKNLIETLAKIPCHVEIASEFRYRDFVPMDGDAAIFISQSGETADTLAALRKTRELGLPTIGLCNVVGSSIAREADCAIFTQAGPEISVASTKAMSSQMLALTIMALYWAIRKELLNREQVENYKQILELLPALLDDNLPEMRKRAKELATRYAGARNFFYLGRGYAWPMALEGALKLKELSYIHAEGHAAGEMKHGPIALIDPSLPTFAIALDDDLFSKMKSNIEEVQARAGNVIALVNKGRTVKAADTWEIPPFPGPLAAFLVLPCLQLFSYEVADFLGKDVDQPRNLAKSVTVE